MAKCEPELRQFVTKGFKFDQKIDGLQLVSRLGLRLIAQFAVDNHNDENVATIAHF